MYCIEESICDTVGTFLRPPHSLGTPIVVRRLGNCAHLAPPLVMPLNEQAEMRVAVNMVPGFEKLINK